MIKRTATTLAHGAKHISKRIVFSYFLDWILILGTAALGGGFSKISGNRHAFSLDDPAISFPFNASHPDTVSVAVLLIVCVVAPGIITAVISLIFVPGPTASRNTPTALIWRRKIWEWNTAWMGLGLALAGAFMVTEGLKDLTGKPRPNLIQRCNPDLSKVNQFHVSGLGLVYPEAPVLVSSGICQQTDSSILNDGFASWPSGHSSFSFAGLFYLTLFICAKFAVAIPFLGQHNYSRYQPTQPSTFAEPTATTTESSLPARNQAAAPPIYLLILAFIPTGTALAICATRYTDYQHAGFDIISGAVIGAFFAWFGFRWYHLPIRQGAGWAWGARTRERAFFLPLGTLGYVGGEGWESGSGSGRRGEGKTVLENGPTEEAMLGGGMEDHAGIPADGGNGVNRADTFGTAAGHNSNSFTSRTRDDIPLVPVQHQYQHQNGV